MAIDWTNGACQITDHFTVNDALMLHAYNRLATEADGADFNKLTALCQKMEEVRAILGSPMTVHCCFRSQEYNQAQGISPTADVHSFSEAMDFDCNESMSITDVQAKLEPFLDQLQIRMERGTTTWIHLDVRGVGPSGRYFTA